MLINLDIQKPNGLMAWEAAVQLKRVSVSAYKTCEDIGKQISSVVTIYVYIMYHFILFHAWRLLPLLLGKWVSGLTQNYL